MQRLCIRRVFSCSWILTRKYPCLVFFSSKLSAITHSRSVFTGRFCRDVVPYKLSDIGEGIRDVVIKEWFVKEGDVVSQFDQICEVQSDKASVTITSRYDGVVRKLHYEVEDTALVGQPLLDIETEEDDEAGPLDSIAMASSEDSEETEELGSSGSFAFADSKPVENTVKKVLATPAVRRIGSEHGIDLSLVQGTGPSGRILKEDILLYKQNSEQGKQWAVSEDTKVEESISVESESSPAVADQIVKLTPYQKGMNKLMTASVEIPHFTYSDEVNMTSLVEMKYLMKSIGKKLNVKLTYMPFLIKAASLALLEFPQINALYKSKEELLLIKAAHNIGVALDTPRGLLVPNIKSCEKRSILEIAAELNAIQEAGSRGALSQAQLSNATFSLSNIGFLGGTYTKPVIAPPEIAIGAIGRIQVLPRFENDKKASSRDDLKIVPMHIMNISWSADHRVLDGATICRFSNLWKSFLEEPKTMLLHLK